MIAVVSSTIYPPEAPPGGRLACVAPEERLEQTRRTVESLAELGFSEIYLADNSAERWRGPGEEYFAPAHLLRFDTPQFENIGIAEAHLLLRALREVPADRPILKLSGRYLLRRRPDESLGAADIQARLYQHGAWLEMSTRCYAVRSRALHERFLRQVLREIYSAPTRAVGPRSLLRLVRGALAPGRVDYPYEDPPSSLERAAGSVLRRRAWNVRAVTELFVEGQAGSVPGLYVRE